MENVWCFVSDAVQLSRDADNSDISDGLRSEIGHNPETNHVHETGNDPETVNDPEAGNDPETGHVSGIIWNLNQSELLQVPAKCGIKPREEQNQVSAKPLHPGAPKP